MWFLVIFVASLKTMLQNLWNVFSCAKYIFLIFFLIYFLGMNVIFKFLSEQTFLYTFNFLIKLSCGSFYLKPSLLSLKPLHKSPNSKAHQPLLTNYVPVPQLEPPLLHSRSDLLSMCNHKRFTHKIRRSCATVKTSQLQQELPIHYSFFSQNL